MNGSFSGPLRTEQIGHQRWRILYGFNFKSKTGSITHVPAGFECDLASIPGIFQSFVSKVGYWSQASVIHDLLYDNHRNGVDTVVTRLEADRLLREGCTVRADQWNVPRGERRTKIIYDGVRFGGLEAWETPKEREERLARLDHSDIIDN